MGRRLTRACTPDRESPSLYHIECAARDAGALCGYLIIKKCMNEQSLDFKGVAEIIYGVLSLSGIFAALYLSWRTYKREHEFSAVPTTTSFQSFNKWIKFCEPVTLELFNRSKYPVIMRVVIHSSGFSIHYDTGTCPPSGYSMLSPQPLHIGPNECFKQDFRIHTLTNWPAKANVIIYVNGKFFQQFVYVYDSNYQGYRLQ